MTSQILTGFQLRAALITSKEEDRKVAHDVGLETNTIFRLRKCQNLSPLRCHKSTNERFVHYFNSIHIFFPEENSIEYRHPDILLLEDSVSLTRFQFAVARISALLTQEALGRFLGVADDTIGRIEKGLNHERLTSRKLTPFQVRDFFEKIGVVFEKPNKISLAQDPTSFLKK